MSFASQASGGSSNSACCSDETSNETQTAPAAMWRVKSYTELEREREQWGPRLRVLVFEFHMGTRSDIVTTFDALGHTAMLLETGEVGWFNSGAFAHKLQPGVLRDARRVELLPALPAHLQKLMFGVDVSDAVAQRFFEWFTSGAGDAARRADVIVCAFIANRCEALLALNRSVIFVADHRFALRRCSTAAMARSVRALQRCAARDTPDAAARGGRPRCVVAAADAYDAAYIQHYTGIVPRFVDLGAYFYAGAHRGVGLNAARAGARRRRPEILLGPVTRMSAHVDVGALQQQLRAACQRNDATFTFALAKELYPAGYSFNDATRHRAIVMFPYAALSYSLLEAQALAIPTFMPSARLMANLTLFIDRWATGYSGYCGARGGFKAHFDAPPASRRSLHAPFSPERLSFTANDSLYWTRLMSEYDRRQMPFVEFFDSLDELIRLLRVADFARTARLMRHSTVQREENLIASMRSLLDGMEPNRQLHGSFGDVERWTQGWRL